MTYFEDLSDYSYFPRYQRPQTKNIGWLEKGRDFDKEVPAEDVLVLLWTFCQVSVVQTRGIHQCQFCEPARTVYAIRNGTRLLLGTSEIRVFSGMDTIYLCLANPDLSLRPHSPLQTSSRIPVRLGGGPQIANGRIFCASP